MNKHTLSLTLAALLATAPALAADWAHNDPDKASTGQVQIWDGSKTVTVNSAPAMAVATMGGGGAAALGGVVQSPLSFSQFITANDLNAGDWKDITWRAGIDSVSITGTELSEKTGKNSINTVKGGDFNIKTYIGTGDFPVPPGSEYEFIPGYIQESSYLHGTSSPNVFNYWYLVHYQTFSGVTGGIAKIRATNKKTIRSTEFGVPVDSSFSVSGANFGPSVLTVKTPGTNQLNSFMKVNE